LGELWIPSPKVTDAGVNALRRHLPQTRINLPP
jgi:hypothetical protein